MARRVALLGALLAGPAIASPCAEDLLRELGWHIEHAAIDTPRIAGGTPCQRASLAQAQAAGDLRAVLPQAPARAQAALQAMFDDPATVCAYAFRLGDAARRASAQLAANEGYRFFGLQTGWIGFGAEGAQAQGWQRFRSFGRGYAPAAANSTALEAFYRGHVRTECGVGRQVAQLATQRELYGDAAFDAAFTPGELSIGTFVTLHDTDSILLGAHAGEFLADGKAVRTSAMGRQAFMGVPGFIEHAFSKRFLDDISNQAENFIVVDVSEQAAQALAAHGGLAYYDGLNRQLWQLSQQVDGLGRRGFERLLHERDSALRARLDPYERQVVARMDAILDDPFYRGFVVYVHPRGVQPIGYHIARLLDRNPRTPYTIDLALHNLHTTLYRRWIDERLRQCAGATYR
ncbi:hypothetical protein P6166_11505 [Stenotrophomonas sp. HITSZ_GD]|uniref:hypothetical protein n=1 Tax=Stenotrophomonas sp. HITSZ_GD TaxID=3037248 RepID=UPI00240E0365|nr:hypothetical protein [Stenotrophomonas sp. HITSZ_GD]MDG2525981.1 hypothetical protein [Stenotrophomonas sp. HITSZ_GD]